MNILEKPILYYMNISPPCRMVKMVIDKLNIDVDIRIVNLYKGEQKSQDILKMNPMGLIPILKHGDHVVNDSHAIAPYLVQTYNKDHEIYPENVVSRAKINEMLAFNMTMLFPRCRFLVKELIEDGIKIPSENGVKSVHEALDCLNSFLKKTEWIAGKNATLADYACITSMATAEMFFKIPEKYEHLLKWVENCQNLPEFKTANKEGLIELRILLDKFRNFS